VRAEGFAVRHAGGAGPRHAATGGDRGSVRLVALLAVLTVLHAFDLAFTHTQLQTGSFVEGNRLAACFAKTPLSLASFKLTLFGLGCAILYALRAHWQAEVGAWFLLTVSLALTVWWIVYLGHVELWLHDPAVICQIDQF